MASNQYESQSKVIQRNTYQSQVGKPPALQQVKSPTNAGGSTKAQKAAKGGKSTLDHVMHIQKQ